MDFNTTTYQVGPLYGRYFSQFALLVWCKEDLFMRDIHRKCHMQWPMKCLMESGYELSAITESLHQISAGQECITKVNVGVGITVSVSYPTPLVTIKTDKVSFQLDEYAWSMFMTSWDELQQIFGVHVEQTILMEGIMKQLYASAIANLIPRIAEENCFGCQNAHPSQIQHDKCMMMDVAELVSLFTNEATKLVDISLLMNSFELCIQELNPKPCFLDYIKWYNEHFRTHWFNSMCHEIEGLIVNEMKNAASMEFLPTEMNDT